jgi:hypothetical protein
MRLPMVFLIALLASSCSQTPYQRMGQSGGYKEAWIDEGSGTVKAVFSRNSFTPRQKGDDLALLRALEVALDKGYGYYLKLSIDQELDGLELNARKDGLDRNTRSGEWIIEIPWLHLTSHTVQIRVFKTKPMQDAMGREVNAIQSKITDLKATYGIK